MAKPRLAVTKPSHGVFNFLYKLPLLASETHCSGGNLVRRKGVVKIRKCGLHGCVCWSPPLQNRSDFYFPFELKETNCFMTSYELYLSVVRAGEEVTPPRNPLKRLWHRDQRSLSHIHLKMVVVIDGKCKLGLLPCPSSFGVKVSGVGLHPLEYC